MFFELLIKSPSADIVLSTSSEVLSVPSDIRIEQCASSSDSPIATSTWDGLDEPLLHAEPADILMP